MQLIVIVHKQGGDEPIELHVPDDCDVSTLHQMITLELGIPVQDQRLEFDNRLLTNGSLSDSGIQDGALVELSLGHEMSQPPRTLTVADIPPNV